MSSILTRRGFLRGLLAAPAVVAAANIMPVRGLVMDWDYEGVPEAFVEFKTIFLGNIRQFLLPGLFDVRGSYDMIPRQWDKVFKQEALT